MPIEHVSLDFWNTIATANPEYTKKRNQFFANFFQNTVYKTAIIYSALKKELDDMSDAHGVATPVDRCYSLLGERLGTNLFPATRRHIRSIIEELFVENPPIILPETVEQLKRIADKGITLSIGSNTNFIPGAVLCKAALDATGIPFLFKIFSDEVGYSKPHKEFFQKIVDNKLNISLDKIVHIGDNSVTDYWGPIKFGIGNVVKIENASSLPAALELI